MLGTQHTLSSWTLGFLLVAYDVVINSPTAALKPSPSALWRILLAMPLAASQSRIFQTPRQSLLIPSSLVTNSANYISHKPRILCTRLTFTNSLRNTKINGPSLRCNDSSSPSLPNPGR
ncbi:hypothetical protein KC19_VG073900 [Ceratodon purpureus]|uniref:Uncharacterized protein n=1 Tax=Ceratodon purpureus TaxID=3225 RepID=A0A8T0HMX6_CERPU|nr:hypothetical protein KC19_VG073900 [Ceratodon purpureus]